MALMKPIHLNLVVPCYNEELVLPETSCQLLALLDRMQVGGMVDAQSSITFVDDGSADGTWQLIESLHHADPRVHGIKLSRNRGHQNALLAGLLSAQGEVLISLDADLQDDIEAIPRMLQVHQQDGADIVYGVRARRDTDTAFKRCTARGYYSLLRKFGVDIVPDHADFRLMSRRALDALHNFREVNLFLRGIIPLLGFRTAVVTYDRLSRFAGESKYPLLKMVRLALEGIFSFSTVTVSLEMKLATAVVSTAAATESMEAAVTTVIIGLGSGTSITGRLSRGSGSWAKMLVQKKKRSR